MKNKFKVGDKVWDKYRGLSATVTKLTGESGFEYDLDTPLNLGSRIGTELGGTVYECGLDNWGFIKDGLGDPTICEDSPEIKRLKECVDPTALKLYDAIYEAGIDGGELTSSAIEEFENYKKLRGEGVVPIEEYRKLRAQFDEAIVNFAKENENFRARITELERQVEDEQGAVNRVVDLAHEDRIKFEARIAQLEKEAQYLRSSSARWSLETNIINDIIQGQYDPMPHTTDYETPVTEKVDNIVKERNILRTRVTELEGKFEDANSALGYHPDSGTDFAAEIRCLRASGREYFHDFTRLLDKNESLISLGNSMADSIENTLEGESEVTKKWRIINK